MCSDTEHQEITIDQCKETVKEAKELIATVGSISGGVISILIALTALVISLISLGVMLLNHSLQRPPTDMITFIISLIVTFATLLLIGLIAVRVVRRITGHSIFKEMLISSHSIREMLVKRKGILECCKVALRREPANEPLRYDVDELLNAIKELE